MWLNACALRRPGVLWTFLIILVLVVRVGFSNCIVAQGLFINNSVTPDRLGAVNGLGITVTSLFRYVTSDQNNASDNFVFTQYSRQLDTAFKFFLEFYAKDLPSSVCWCVHTYSTKNLALVHACSHIHNPVINVIFQ